MASVSTDANGNVRILFVGPDKKRRAIRLGKVTQKVAEGVKLRVEHLAASHTSNLPLDPDTARWVGTVADDLAAKFAAVGLIPERRSQRLGQFLDEFVAGRKADGAKANTLDNYNRVVKDLLAAFGPATRLRDITADHAEQLKAAYQTKKLAAATQHRQLKFAKHFFAHAVKRKLIPENPFADVKAANATPVQRRKYVTAGDTERLIAVANPTWRIIVALCRFAGLRCPSEVLSLRWEHIDFAAGRMTVTSPKTEHLEGKGYRVVPIFAALRPHLEDAHELAEPGEVYVVGGRQGDGYREAAGENWKNANLRTTFLKLIRRAGLLPWPKPFHNLRASCETDLMRYHGIHVVTAWLGNTPTVALTHYLQVLDADFDRAVRGDAEGDAPVAQIQTRSRAERTGAGRKEGSEKAVPSGITSAPLRCGATGSDVGSEQEYTRQELNL